MGKLTEIYIQQEIWWTQRLQASKPHFLPNLWASFCCVTDWGFSLHIIWALNWILFRVTRVSFIKLQLQSTRWVCGGKSFKEQLNTKYLTWEVISYLRSCAVCVFWLLVVHNYGLLIHFPSGEALSTLCVPWKIQFCGGTEMKIRYSLIFKKP